MPLYPIDANLGIILGHELGHTLNISGHYGNTQQTDALKEDDGRVAPGQAVRHRMMFWETQREVNWKEAKRLAPRDEKTIFEHLGLR